MPDDATPDPYAHPLVFGQRMQILRTRRGLSRPVLAGLLGRSPSWVKQVENGAINTPSLPMILRVAEVLRVSNLADLTGDRTMTADLFTGPGHRLLPAVKEAVNAFPVRSDREPTPVTHLRHRLDRAWSARHAAARHREVVGDLLPDLIRDAQCGARAAETSAERRAMQAILSEVYSLAQFFVAYQPDSSLLWRVAERGMVAAQESEDPHAIGIAGWLTVQAHRGAGQFDAADTVNAETLRFLGALLPDASNEVRAVAGALHFEAGYTAARRGESGAAWRQWDTARTVARSLPPGYYHPVTSFSTAVMSAHAVTVAVELHAGPESAKQVARADGDLIPSRPRRARHRIEEARAYQLDGQPDVALATLAKAHEAAPETIAYNGYARRIVLEETGSRSPERRRRAGELAVKLGGLAA
ncbi:helix-turn-helix domain-containing protein [Streptomyces sp. I05A-00742]|uniref:helix-turn-helix domain-containing protein n=1 Tax=Streptomyces sp. I05A-00742 TaxID=2732853 RepID=UPI001489E348|nr:helix-turn-helix transcriptional regulator [Streptomyces sp. I05A-00742]